MAEGAGKKKRGPRSKAGKRAVRLNPVKHGVLSQTPVLPLVERAEDWVRLREGTFDYFQVEGMVEETLADQIAMLMSISLTAMRRGRVTM
jgi:hypothetical protein